MRKSLWIGILVAVICLYVAFRGISLPQLGIALSHAHPGPIFIALAIYVIGYFLRALRWSILLKPVQAIKAPRLLGVMMIGYFANNVLPLRMGEFVRAHLCGKKFNISRTASLGSILLERIFDTLSFLSTFIAASFLYPFPRYMEKGAWLLGGACFLVIIALVFIRIYQHLFQRLIERTAVPPVWKIRIKELTSQFVHSTSGMTQPRYIIEALLLSLIIWMIEGTFLYCVMQSFEIHLPYAGAFFLLFALGLSVTLPQGPGYVGTFELFGVTALTLLGIPKEQALPVILTIHGTQFLFVCILGSLGLWKEGLSFQSLAATS